MRARLRIRNGESLEGRLMLAAEPVMLFGEQGTFFGGRTIELRVDNPSPGLEIHYTLDGTDPTIRSMLYSGPIELTESVRLQARSFDTSVPNSDPSEAVSGIFFSLSEELRDRASNLPIVILDTLGHQLRSSNVEVMSPLNVVIFGVDEATGLATIEDGVVEYLGRAGARGLNDGTLGQAKPNMRFETWGPNGNGHADASDVNLFQMGSDREWALHAPFAFDRALIRNQFGFEMSRQMGRWAPEFRNVEVYVNQRDGLVDELDFAGLYVLHETVKAGPDRIDIAPIDPAINKSPDDPDLEPGEPNISGGYIWSIDRAEPGEPRFVAGGQQMNWVDPKAPDSPTAAEAFKATRTQQDWVIDYFETFVATLTEPDINDPEGYSKYINPVSWVDHHLQSVWMMNVDALRLSSYLYKDRDSRIEYGPVWDLDRSIDSLDDRDDDPFVWRPESGDLGTDYFGDDSQRWWSDLFRDPGFWQLYVDRWQMWRRTVLSDESVGATIDQTANEIAAAAARNFSARVNRGVRPRHSSGFESHRLDGTWDGEIQNMRQWLAERASFMDANFVSPPTFSVGGELVPADVTSRLVAPGAEISLRGTPTPHAIDSRLISGEPGEATASYLVPTDNSLGTRWTEIGFDDSSWASGPIGLGFDVHGDEAEALIRTVVEPSTVAEGATTVLSRLDFEVQDLAQIRERDLILRMKYDDGFVAYLNGTEVTRANLRNQRLSWNSRAWSRPGGQALEFEEFDLSMHTNLLIEGPNTLAIRTINSSSTGRDLLMLPELVARETRVEVSPNARIYYTTDGTDPRAADGAIGASALLFQPGENLDVHAVTRVIARTFDDVTDRGQEARIVLTDWSGPVRMEFRVEGSGDFNGDDRVDVRDLDALLGELWSPAPNPAFDLTGDGMVTDADRDVMVQDILQTAYGDANLDRVFNSQDLTSIFQAGEYADGIAGNSSWAEGDWSGDGEFDSNDLVLAFQSGGYVASAHEEVFRP